MSSEAFWAALKSTAVPFEGVVVPATQAAEREIALATRASRVWGSHFGATGIHPRFLFIYFVLPTREEVCRFRVSTAWTEIKERLRVNLEVNGYPISVLQENWVDLFSEQECKEKSDGSWYHFFS
ncbi:MAG: hypothetical protein OEY75_00995 [Hylemonella sp.]|nr:hypothetical protein [Hylemonella sp.]MDH5707662.1 hypothetical protein [Hylemonella sp.]